MLNGGHIEIQSNLCKQPAKMSSLGGHLQKVVAYKSLDKLGPNFASLEYNCRDLPYAPFM